MADIKPFRALRPRVELAKQVAAKPYDVLSSEEARVEARDNPISFLHITKSEIDLPANIDIHSEAVYEKAKENLARLISEGILFREEKPCYYIYQLVMPAGQPGGKVRSQTGLVCVSSVDDYFNGIIKKHEFTRPEKEQDRINHILATRAQTGNVFLAYKDVRDLDDVLEQWKSNNNAVYNFTADDGVQHTIWIIDTIATIDIITNLFKEKVPFTYIADGHHRAASAAKVSQLPEFASSANQDVNYFLTTIFPANQLSILDYNRLVKDMNGLSESEFLEKLKDDFTIEKTNAPFSPKQMHQFGMYINGEWYILTAKDGNYTGDPIGVLDVTILSKNILDKLLGIKDQRTDKRIDFVGGIRGLSQLEKRVNSGEMRVAFSLHPVTIQQLFDIADSGNVMPPKSTWFEPKLRDGLLTHLISV